MLGFLWNTAVVKSLLGMGESGEMEKKDYRNTQYYEGRNKHYEDRWFSYSPV